MSIDEYLSHYDCTEILTDMHLARRITSQILSDVKICPCLGLREWKPNWLKCYDFTGWPKKWHSFLYASTSSNINRFSKLFHCQNQDKMCNNTITKDPTKPYVCRYTVVKVSSKQQLTTRRLL